MQERRGYPSGYRHDKKRPQVLQQQVFSTREHLAASQPYAAMEICCRRSWSVTRCFTGEYHRDTKGQG